MFTLKSHDPRSITTRFIMHHQTTASVGSSFFIVPFRAELETLRYGFAVSSTSNRTFDIRNLTKSMNYLNTAAIGSGTIGYVTQMSISASDAHTSGGGPRAVISANSLLRLDWTASMMDGALTLELKAVPDDGCSP